MLLLPLLQLALLPGPTPVRQPAPALASGGLSRRGLLLGVPAAIATLGLSPLAAHAKSGVPTEGELANLAKGYSRLQYLLANWEKLTTVCIKGCVGPAEQCGCIRDPVIVQSYLGFKSMDDPLVRDDYGPPPPVPSADPPTP